MKQISSALIAGNSSLCGISPALLSDLTFVPLHSTDHAGVEPLIVCSLEIRYGANIKQALILCDVTTKVLVKCCLGPLPQVYCLSEYIDVSFKLLKIILSCFVILFCFVFFFFQQKVDINILLFWHFPFSSQKFLEALKPDLKDGKLPGKTVTLGFYPLTSDIKDEVTPDLLPLAYNDSVPTDVPFDMETYQTNLQTQVLGNLVLYAEVLPTTMTVFDGWVNVVCWWCSREYIDFEMWKLVHYGKKIYASRATILSHRVLWPWSGKYSTCS